MENLKELRESLIKHIDEAISKAQKPKELIIGKKYRVIQEISEKGKIGICKGGFLNSRGTRYYDFENLIHQYSADQVELVEDEKLPYNTWYINYLGGKWYFINEEVAHGFTSGGDWYRDLYNMTPLNSPNYWTPCEAPIDLLTKEAERKGYKEGVNVKDTLGAVYGLSNIGCIKFDHEGFWYKGSVVMKDGIWAEIIKDDKIMIAGYEVKFVKDDEGDFGAIVVNGKSYGYIDIVAHKAVLELGHKIMVGCSNQYELTLSTVNKILAKL
jgi:hypothetical protein